MEGNNFLESVKVWPTRTRDYVKELQNEMRRVTWPNRKQVEGTTVVVILTVFAFAGFFCGSGRHSQRHGRTPVSFAGPVSQYGR